MREMKDDGVRNISQAFLNLSHIYLPMFQEKE